MPLLWCRCMRRSEAECMESSSGEWQGKSLHRGQLEKLHSLWARYVRDSIPLLAWASKFFRYIRLIKFPRFQQQMLLNLGTEKSRPLMCIVHSGCRTSGSIWKTREYHLVCHRLIHHASSTRSCFCYKSSISYPIGLMKNPSTIYTSCYSIPVLSDRPWLSADCRSCIKTKRNNGFFFFKIG